MVPLQLHWIQTSNTFINAHHDNFLPIQPKHTHEEKRIHGNHDLRPKKSACVKLLLLKLSIDIHGIVPVHALIYK